MKEKMIIVPAEIEQLQTVLTFIDGFIEDINEEENSKNHIKIAMEEAFTNIVSYAYGDAQGMVEIRCERWSEGIQDILKIQIRDRGVPFNPLKHPTPDFELAFAERKTGGLGIHMIKAFMDRVAYRWEDGWNILELEKTVLRREHEKTV